MNDTEKLTAAYWRLHDAREIVRSTLPVLRMVAADGEALKAMEAIGAALGVLKAKLTEPNALQAFGEHQNERS